MRPKPRRRRAAKTGERCPVTRKRSYLGYKVAAKVARIQDERSGPYLCTHCGRWHVTSMSKAEYDKHQLKYYAQPKKEEPDVVQ